MIIGISGKKQSGKNTVGVILQCLHENINFEGIKEVIDKGVLIYDPNNMELVSFAFKLKEIASSLIGVKYWDFENQTFKKEVDPLTGLTNREILQKIGTSFRELFGEDIWIKALFKHLECIGFDKNYIITDVRYKNEAKAIKEKGGILIRVNRNTDSNDTHQSEVDLDDYDKFDFIIDNNGSVEELIKKVIEIYDKLF